MAENPQRRGALDEFGSEPGTQGEGLLRLAVKSPPGQLVLRGDAGSAAFRSAVREVTGSEPPTTPLSAAVSDDVTLLWMGPDEWLVVMPDGRRQQVMQALQQALAGEHHAVCDVSSSRAVIELSGPGARETLMKGCSLDLHPREFRPGRVDQSSLARCHVMLHLRDDTPSFDVYVHRSFSHYCWLWLCDAAREYQQVGAA